MAYFPFDSSVRITTQHRQEKALNSINIMLIWVFFLFSALVRLYIQNSGLNNIAFRWMNTRNRRLFCWCRSKHFTNIDVRTCLIEITHQCTVSSSSTLIHILHVYFWFKIKWKSLIILKDKLKAYYGGNSPAIRNDVI